MAEATTTATADTTTAATTSTTQTPWHNGIEADTIGFWQNKGLTLDDPKAVFTGVSKMYRELEKHVGAPPDQLLKLPKADAKPEEWKSVYQRLGAPADPKEYDLSGIKYGGEDLEPAFVDAMRASLAAAFVPKDKAATVVKTVVDYLENADKAEGAITQSKIDAERAALKADWGPNFDFNHLKAMEGARRLGITPEAVKALEGQIGYKSVMEAMRKIGQGTSEATWVDGANKIATVNGVNVPATREGAAARLNELMNDAAWGKRLTSGDQETVNEWRALTTMIDGEAA
jgi:hypothetical protein